MGDSEILYSRATTLITAGQDLNLDMPEALARLEPFEGWDAINRTGWQVWDRVAERLTLADLILLTQILTVLEREFEWPGGSVSSVIWLLQNLRRREPRIAALVADWVVQRTNNQYLPFGSHSSRQQWIDSRMPRVNLRAVRAAIARYSAENREKWEARRAADLECERKAEALAREAEEAKAAYTTGTPVATQRLPADLLRYVALDMKHSVEFFPKAWARVSRDDLLQLAPGARAALVERLARTSSVTWHRLYKRLIEIDSA
jgi:hypothetical protein